MNQFKILLGLLPILFFQCQNPIQNTDNQPIISLGNPPKEVQIFGENTISTNLNERDIAISPDGNEIIFTLQNYHQTSRALVSLKNENGKWNEPKILPFSGKYGDIEPFFSPEGNQLFFASNRPIPDSSERKDYNIWVVEKTSTDWGIPFPLPEIINTEKDEFYPSVGKSGNLYFTATYPGGVGSEDIWISKFLNGNYLPPTPLDTNVNSKTYEFNSFVSPDEDLLIFTSYGRPDGLGGGDLYFSRKDDSGNWTKSIHLDAPINSKKLDYCPFVDFSNSTFYFTSNRGAAPPEEFKNVSEIRTYSEQVLNGFGNIYQVDLKSLE